MSPTLKSLERALGRLASALACAAALAACDGTAVVGGNGNGSDGGMDATADIPCSADQVRCGGQCVNVRQSVLHCGACGTACPAGNVCVNGACMQSCPGTQTLCSGNLCVSTGTDRANCGACGNACAAGQVCSNGACTVECAANLQTCSAGSDAGADASGPRYCADPQTDRNNCGGCGNVCPGGRICERGMCVVSCGVGLTNCDGTCRDLQMDRANCGGCGTVCAAGQVCSSGTCQVSCGGGLTDCTGVCRDTQSDNAHCGACGTACAAGQVCSRGACELTCAAGLTTCGGSCRDLTTDNNHCGACGMLCPAGQVCSGSMCRTTCAMGTTDCSGACRDLQTDRANCGMCGQGCMPGRVCSAGTCQVSCGAGTTDCGGVCRDVQTDNANCGMCGTACASGQVCTGGMCVVSCGAGLTNCAGTCRDTQTDTANCGACGTACAAGQVCANGACAASCQAGTQNCSGSCRNTQTDITACGGCGIACPTPANGAAFCTAGRCGITCGTGFGDCDAMAGNGCETTLSSITNCNGCNVRCNFANAAAACLISGCTMGSCTAGFADCNNSPMDGCEIRTGADNNNCGGCGVRCVAGQTCSNGACAATCAAGQSECSGVCRNLDNDPSHCTACGNVCPRPANATPFCASRCAYLCTAGFGDCDGQDGNGCETRLDSVTNCGACGFTCRFPNGAAACTAGRCALTTCATGFSNCDANADNGCEVNTQSDRANCGGCDIACGAGQVCSSGVCRATCAAGLTECSGSCTSVQTDPNNCGVCARACTAPANASPVCLAGVCSFVCNAGFRDCDNNPANGCEVNTNTSVGNCGTCGNACSFANAAAVCTAGACGLSACNAGFRDCDGDVNNGCEINTTTSATNCGGCGTVCSLPNATPVCTASVCQVAACTGAFRNCDSDPANGCEVNTSNSASHCGACGVTCPSGVCTNGACVVMSNRYQESFVNNVTPTTQCTAWNTWRAGLAGGYTRVTIRGTFAPAGLSCSNPSIANALAAAIRTGADFDMACDGHRWTLCGSRYSGELWLDPPSLCSGSNCPSGYLVRPCIGNQNWGGVNTTTCTDNPNQEMIVEFQ